MDGDAGQFLPSSGSITGFGKHVLIDFLVSAHPVSSSAWYG